MSSNGGLRNIPPFPPEYRAAGLLLHVTSLPSPYGIGDLGPSAFHGLIASMMLANDGGRRYRLAQLVMETRRINHSLRSPATYS
jgi:hypothetical protein